MNDFPELLPHDEIYQVFPDVYGVVGQIPVGPGGDIKISRTMTIIREGDALTLLNTVRLDGQGLAKIDALGHVRHIVKLGAFHGRDDAFYVDRYPDALMWAPRGMPHARGVKTQRELSGSSTPLVDGSAFIFEHPTLPEALVRLDRHDGILIACDSLQNRETPDHFHSEGALERTPALFGRGIIGPGWRNATQPTDAKFRALAALNFRHLLSGHGTPLLEDAREVLKARI